MKKLFGYDKLLSMNTGVEACETAFKLTTKWTYKLKGISNNGAKVILAEKHFWVRSLAACSFFSDPNCCIMKDFAIYARC